MPPLPRPRSANPVAGPDTFTFRPRTAWISAVVWGLVVAGWLTLALTGSAEPIGAASRQLPAIALGCVVVYAVCVRPVVRVGAEGVWLRNVVRDVWLPFADLARVETQYALTLVTVSGRRHQAWAAPAPSRHGAARVTDGDVREMGWTPDQGPVPASATLRSDAGAAAVTVRRMWDAHRAADGRPAAGTEVRWARGVLAALAVTALAVGLASVLAGAPA
ncbi:PH domain-containing protein [Nakamurella flavida]|uniref:PH domain-containing protein n=1 Tax=Nakamurella flavida TaxID=363630 RepID=A0A938YLL1_9ACTN|nr:PH domain-containing protein [Nakamurella flavida]MBM9476943.1 PH domain-containing protein [Nakamurella flavida]MDP9779888.1 hypothetical protein [Nakamurella flavida]